MVLARIEATPRSATPPRITDRGPTRSTTMPTSGARRPWTRVESESAPAVSARDQRNSSTRGTKKIENEKNRPLATATITQTPATILAGVNDPAHGTPRVDGQLPRHAAHAGSAHRLLHRAAHGRSLRILPDDGK